MTLSRLCHGLFSWSGMRRFCGMSAGAQRTGAQRAGAVDGDGEAEELFPSTLDRPRASCLHAPPDPGPPGPRASLSALELPSFRRCGCLAWAQPCCPVLLQVVLQLLLLLLLLLLPPPPTRCAAARTACCEPGRGSCRVRCGDGRPSKACRRPFESAAAERRLGALLGPTAACEGEGAGGSTRMGRALT
jgi:hypothetical protein